MHPRYVLRPAFVCLLSLFAGGCSSTASSEAADLAAAKSVADAPPLIAWQKSSDRRPVVLYVDRSGSMRGYLDPAYPSRVRTDYRSVIDGLVVGLAPGQAFGFGSALRPVSASLGALGDLGFYSDNNTLLEQVVDRIAIDSLLQASHVIVGDGRRSSPNSANHQYVRMRQLAERWIDDGGTFIVGASMAPFRQIPNDPAGCSPPPGGEIATCALYAFAYVAPGDESRIAGVVADRFEHVFVWPVPALPGGSLAAQGADPSPVLRLERAWQRATDLTPILRSRGLSFSNTPVRVRVALGDTTSLVGATHAAILRGQQVRGTVTVKPLLHAAADWLPAGGSGSLVRFSEAGSLDLDLTTRGSASDRFVYRVEVFPSGVPAWLEEFDAENAADRVRTYGLARLFEPFRNRAEAAGVNPIGRLYVVAN